MIAAALPRPIVIMWIATFLFFICSHDAVSVPTHENESAAT